MIRLTDLLTFLLLICLIVNGSIFGPRYGTSELAGAGLGFLSFVALVLLFLGGAFIYDGIQYLRGKGPKRRQTFGSGRQVPENRQEKTGTQE
jgi:hypothetical protein